MTSGLKSQSVPSALPNVQGSVASDVIEPLWLVERRAIERAVRICKERQLLLRKTNPHARGEGKGNAAKALGINRLTLYKRLSMYAMMDKHRR